MRLTNHRFLLLIRKLCLLMLTVVMAMATTSNAFIVTTKSSNSCTTTAAMMERRRPFSMSSSASASSSASEVSILDLLADVTFTVSVQRPLGVIFGENPQPLLGLVVDDVSPGLNGGAAGIRNGDQLVAVNGQMVVGRDFDFVMNMLLQENNSPLLKLTMFRGGSALDLYTILQNVMGDNDGGIITPPPEEDVVVIDENYEAPRVVFDDVQEKPLTVGSVLNIFKKIGSNVADDMMRADAAAPSTAAAAGSNKKEEAEGGSKKEQGLFSGMFGGGETIQLDGNDASSLK